MAKFTIIYNDNGTVTRILDFLGRSFTYEWNRTDMTQPDFRKQILSAVDGLESTHIPAILDNLSYYNDDLPMLVGTLADYEGAANDGSDGVASGVPP